MDNKVQYWIDLAEYDIETAEAMFETKRFLYVGFMCHQVIEKSLKGYYVFVKNEIPDIDILMDDGGHSMKQQKTTFEELFDKVKEDGLYVIEDLHTSYMKFYGGGYKKSRSFIEFSKNFIDKLHAWHTKRIPVDIFVKSTHSLHYYDSVLVIEKRKMSAPFDVKAGIPSITDKDANMLLVKPPENSK